MHALSYLVSFSLFFKDWISNQQAKSVAEILFLFSKWDCIANSAVLLLLPWYIFDIDRLTFSPWGIFPETIVEGFGPWPRGSCNFPYIPRYSFAKTLLFLVFWMAKTPNCVVLANTYICHFKKSWNMNFKTNLQIVRCTNYSLDRRIDLLRIDLFLISCPDAVFCTLQYRPLL